MGVDAHLLVFEYLTGFFLRPRQVELVRELAAVGVNGGARVTQMLMGEGKTTVVAPLLALTLADGQRSVAMCVPAPLIPQTRDVLSRTFGRIWPRRVIEFEYGVSQEFISLPEFDNNTSFEKDQSVEVDPDEAAKIFQEDFTREVEAKDVDASEQTGFQVVEGL